MSRNSYFEHHDNRVPGHRGPMGRNRRVGYSRVLQTPRGRPRFQDPDGDIDMNAPGSSWNSDRKLHPYRNPKMNSKKGRRGKNSQRNHGMGLSPHHLPDSPWYRVTIPHGRKLGKQFVLESIKGFCKTPFEPFNFHFDTHCAVFFLNRLSSAIEVKNSSRTVTAPDGFKMTVNVSPSIVPNITVDQEVIAKLKECMSCLYDSPTHALNLSRLEHNDVLRNLGLYMAPCRPNVLSTIVKIIKENIPELEILDLSDNMLNNLSPLKSLVPACTQLKMVSLKNNRIRSMNELNNLKGLELRSLILDGNPVCDSYKEPSSYIDAIRVRFPRLVLLDGHELPAPIGFDLGSEHMPPSKGSFFIAEDVKNLVVQFLEQYYMIYDSENRDKLLDAYHENAMFSLCIPKHSDSSNLSKNVKLYHYTNESRNIIRVTDSASRNSLLKQNRIGIVSTLSQLPVTQHDPQSFVIDIFQVTPGLMGFSVSGVFKEVGPDMENVPLRTFYRTFIVAPRGQGFVITNEMLFIANATQEQIKAFKFPAPTPSPSPAPSNNEKSPAEKQQLALEFMKFCGMNLDFTVKLLEEHDWDSQRSAAVFTELNNLGRIPPEAFIHK